MKQILVCILVLVAGTWHATPTRAGPLDFALASPTQTGAPGDVLTFIGTITNPGASDVFLNGTLSLIPVGLHVDDDPFFLNTPLFLAPGGSFMGELFDVDIAADTAPGTYPGSLAILGGADGNSFDNLASVVFSVTVGGVSTVPEPNAILLFATALLIGLINFGWRIPIKRQSAF